MLLTLLLITGSIGESVRAFVGAWWAMSPDAMKTLAETFAAAMTGIGIGAAGFWTYMLFVRQRTRFPRAKVSHSPETLRLTNDAVLLNVGTRVENTGHTVICVRELDTRVLQVLPLLPEMRTELQERGNLIPEGKSEVPWRSLSERQSKWKSKEVEVEPGESEVLPCNFIIPAHVEVVEVYSYVVNRAKRRWRRRPIGWHAISLINVSESEDRVMKSKPFVPARPERSVPASPLEERQMPPRSPSPMPQAPPREPSRPINPPPVTPPTTPPTKGPKK